MKNINEEYFYLRGSGINIPLIDYVNPIVDDDIDLLTDPYEENKVIMFRFSEPVPQKPEMGDLHSCAVKMVVSQKIKTVLEELNLKDVQLIPATIRNLADEEIEGYSIIHIYNYIACMDMEKSDWKEDSYHPGSVYSIKKLVLDSEKLKKIPIENRLIFALDEEYLTTLYHHSVIEKILGVKPTGVGVYCLADWDISKPFKDEFMEYILS